MPPIDSEEYTSLDEDGPRVLIFLHLPKAGGTTFANVIRRQFPKTAICDVSFERPDTFSRFFSMTDTEKSRIRCVAGHFPFGIHEHIPRKPFYVTMFRDPVKRFISEYRYLKEYPEVRTHLPIPENALESFASYLAYAVSTGSINWQVRQAGGFLPMGQLSLPLPSLPDNATEIAIANLDRTCVVTGTLEYFDESLVLLKRRLGWTRSIYYLRENVNKRFRTHEEISPSDLEHLAEILAPDQRLYDYASLRLAQDIQREGPDFTREVARFQMINNKLVALQGSYQRFVPRSLRLALRRFR